MKQSAYHKMYVANCILFYTMRGVYRFFWIDCVPITQTEH